MKITLKNKELATTINFLKAIPVKGEDSRHRTKLKKQLELAFGELIEAEKELMSEYELLDENKELLPLEKQNVESVAKFKTQQNILWEEEVVIESGAYVKNFNEMPRILKDYEGELSGDEADIYDRLLDQMEEQATTKATDK